MFLEPTRGTLHRGPGRHAGASFRVEAEELRADARVVEARVRASVRLMMMMMMMMMMVMVMTMMMMVMMMGWIDNL